MQTEKLSYLLDSRYPETRGGNKRALVEQHRSTLQMYRARIRLLENKVRELKND